MTEETTRLIERVLAWIDDDPDPASADELRGLLAQLPDDGIRADLDDRFSGLLQFGTAGLRGPLRAGPNGMNAAVVTRAAAGLVAYLAEVGTDGPVVIGYDAREGSHDFAVDTAQVVAGAGRIALMFPAALPTPVLAFAVRALDASAGVMVTASHNPAYDNGYKVYLGGPDGLGAQIAPPADAQISRHIASVGALPDVPRSRDYSILDGGIHRRYIAAAGAVVPPDAPRELRVVSTALHGVGGPTLAAAFEAAGFAAPVPVLHQQRPDPRFGGLPFPNPEEPGVLEALLALAAEQEADLAIANDPDADRCAAAVPTASGWRVLSGNELGILLADHLIERGEHGTFATTIVSSSLLAKLCAARGRPYAETLTGFKWIARAPQTTGIPLRYGFEEAIGYCVDPASVNDKDGISAAVLTAGLVASLKAAGSTVAQRLGEIYAEFGHHDTSAVSVRVTDLSMIAATMAALRSHPPVALGETAVEMTDLRPRTDGVMLRGDRVRVVIRPSGTEPKLKAYLEVVGESAEQTVTRMAALRAAVTGLIGA